MPATSDIDAHDDLDDEGLEVQGEPAADPEAAPAEGGRPSLSAWWARQSKGNRAMVIAAGVVLGLIGMGQLPGCDGGNDDSNATTETTLPAESYFQDLPTPAPGVSAALQPGDTLQFVNAVQTNIADGTSICDVFFGWVVRENPTTHQREVRWAITTPAMQAKTATGVHLPSAAYPIRAFYGPPCNVAQTDKLLVPPPTTTTVAGVAGKAPS